MIDPIKATHATSDAIKQHGFPLVLASFLTACFCFFTWSLWETTQRNAIEIQKLNQEQLNKLDKRLDEERAFSRSQLIDTIKQSSQTIDRNTEAIERLSDGLRSKI